jgi:murein DD-endopeptidase MepM/ murein hydrolase activator NlpD
VSVTASDDFASNTSTAGVVGINSSSLGRIDFAADYDWFRVTLVAGTTYQLRENGNTLSDPYLILRNSSGSILLRDNDSGGNHNSLITFTPSTTGAYYLDAGGYGSNIGTYNVSVTIADDYAATTATTGALSVNASTIGKIEVAGDYDWFRVTLVAGTTYQLRENGNTLSDPYLILRNSSGSILLRDNDSGGNHNSLITFTPSTTGAYYLDAGGYGSNIGTYNVSVIRLDTTAPTVSSFSPTDGATGVAVGSNIVLTFSESIQKGAGTIAIHSGSATGTTIESYNVASSSNITVSGNTLTINPTTNLVNNTHYFVTLTSSSVKDIAGNNYAGTTSYDFTTVSNTGRAVLLPFDSSHIHNVIQGMNNSSFTHKGSLTWGVDFNFSYGEPVLSVSSGVVIDIRERIPDGGSVMTKIDSSNPANTSGIGNFVTVQMDNGTFATYAHLMQNTVDVSVGDRVYAGTVLGKTGNTGLRDGTHLHIHFGTTTIQWQDVGGNDGPAGAVIADGLTSSTPPDYFSAIGNRAVTNSDDHLIGDNSIALVGVLHNALSSYLDTI